MTAKQITNPQSPDPATSLQGQLNDHQLPMTAILRQAQHPRMTIT